MTYNECQPPRVTVQEWIDAYWRTGDIHLDKPESVFAGAVLKCAEGVGYLSEKRRLWAMRQVESAQRCNPPKPFQWYDFARPDLRPGAEGGAIEGQAFVEAIFELAPPTVIRYADGSTADVWLDLERDTPDMSGFQWVQSWLAVVEGLGGYRAGYYANAEWFDDNGPVDDATMAAYFPRPDGSKRALWTARYGKNDGVAPNLRKYPHGPKVQNWYMVNRGGSVVRQWTSNRTSPNIADPHDSNLVYLAAD